MSNEFLRNIEAAPVNKEQKLYARKSFTEVEHAADLKQIYMERVLSLEGYTDELFMKAVYVNAVVRLIEQDTSQMRQLLENILNERY